MGAFILPPEVTGPDDMKIVVNAEQYGINGERVSGTIARDAPLKMRADFDGARLTIKIIRQGPQQRHAGGPRPGRTSR